MTVDVEPVLDLPKAHILAYYALQEADRPLSKRELATEIHRSMRTVTRVVNDLQDEGLVDRRVHPEDRRAHVFSPAPGR